MDHLDLDGSKAQRAIITGDPSRVEEIAAHLGGGRVVANRRGFLVQEALCGDEPVLVVATGIGGPATAIVVEELAEASVHTVVRLGTCGAVAPDLKPGDLVLATGAVRDEGTTRQYIEAGFPAVPDLDLTAEIAAALKTGGWRYQRGIVHSKDAYYLERAERQLLPSAAEKKWVTLRRAGVVATEMESAALFVLGSLRGLRTATVLIAVGRFQERELHGGALHTATAAIATALQSLGALTSQLRSVGPRHSFLETRDDFQGA